MSSGMRGMFATAFLATLLSAGGASARGKEVLRAHLMPLVSRARSNAPVSAEVKFDWQGSRLLEGRLDIVFRSGNDVLARFRSDELALTSGEQVKSMMLPAIRNTAYRSQIEAEMRFLSGRKAHRLGTDTLFASTSRQRSLVICVSDPRGAASRRRTLLVGSMRLERFRHARDNEPERPLSTYPAHLAPEELPARPLGYCSYDMVLLAGDGFSRLKKGQLEALGRWVGAGGSVCILPGSGVKDHHVDFLNGLADDAQPTFSRQPQMDADGRRSEGDTSGQDVTIRVHPRSSAVADAGTGIAMLHPGLGRAVVVTRPLDPDRDAGSPEWRRAVAFLWKVRRGQLNSVLETGKWQKRPEVSRPSRQDSDYREYEQGSGGQVRFHLMPIQVGAAFLKSLIPETVELVPFGLVVFILVLFVLAIGPLDYFILGKLKRRSLTWVVFPAVSIFFAVFTVYLSNLYMGRTDHRNSITFVDLGARGKVLRRSTYEVVFAAGNKTAVTEVSGGLFAALDHKEFGEAGESYRYYGRPARETDVPVPLIQGRMPSRFFVRQEIRQWTPQLNRFFSLAPTLAGPAVPEGVKAPEGIKLDWDAIDPSELGSSGFARRVKKVIFGGRPGDACVRVYHGEAVTDVVIGRGGSFPSSIIDKACRRTRWGLFSVVSQVSPTGGPNFEDVSVLDSTDPAQRLLVVVKRVGGSYFVYRRLYR